MMELLESVREFLETKITPSVDKTTAYYTRVAMNVIAIVERELEKGPALEAAEHARLRRLLNRDGSPRKLNAALCRQLREGEIDDKDPDLIEHLRLTTLGRLSIDNPRYAAYRRALEGTEKDHE